MCLVSKSIDCWRNSQPGNTVRFVEFVEHCGSILNMLYVGAQWPCTFSKLRYGFFTTPIAFEANCPQIGTSNFTSFIT